MSQTADSVTITTPGATVFTTTVSSASMSRVRVSGGRSHGQGALRGMKIGAVVVGGGFAVVFGGAYLLADGPKDPGILPAFVLAAAFQGALCGAIIGGIVGAEKWTTVYSSRVRLSVWPAPSGATTFGLAIKF